MDLDLKPLLTNGQSVSLPKANAIRDQFFAYGMTYLDETDRERTPADAVRRIEKTLKLAETRDANWWINGGKGRDFRAELKKVADTESEN